MTTVGMREFKNQASEFIRRVEAGEAIAITNHGRVVARLVPPAATRAEIEEALGLLDHMDQIAQELDWPADVTVDDVLSDVRRDL